MRAGTEALAAGGVPVAAVGLSNQEETIVPWDQRTGAPRGPAVSWQDRRAAMTCRRPRDSHSELAAITGLPLDPYFAAPKLAWLRERTAPVPFLMMTASEVWLRHRLTGSHATAAATASRILRLDLDRGDWSPAPTSPSESIPSTCRRSGPVLVTPG